MTSSGGLNDYWVKWIDAGFLLDSMIFFSIIILQMAGYYTTFFMFSRNKIGVLNFMHKKVFQYVLFNVIFCCIPLALPPLFLITAIFPFSWLFCFWLTVSTLWEKMVFSVINWIFDILHCEFSRCMRFSYFFGYSFNINILH